MTETLDGPDKNSVFQKISAGRKTVDFHSHILPGIDDGSPNAETSVQMLHMAAEQGVDIQILTPHYYPWRETVKSFSQRRSASFQRLSDAWKMEKPTLFCGAEVAFFSNISRQDTDLIHTLCVEGSRILLIEMPFQSWTSDMADEIATLSLDRGFQIVLAHIERYLRYKRNRTYLEQMANLPIMLQINAETFLRYFGVGKVLNFVKTGHKILLGSDAHNLTDRKPNLAAARRRIENKFGGDVLRMMDESAMDALNMIDCERIRR